MIFFTESQGRRIGPARWIATFTNERENKELKIRSVNHIDDVSQRMDYIQQRFQLKRLNLPIDFDDAKAETISRRFLTPFDIEEIKKFNPDIHNEMVFSCLTYSYHGLIISINNFVEFKHLSNSIPKYARVQKIIYYLESNVNSCFLEVIWYEKIGVDDCIGGTKLDIVKISNFECKFMPILLVERKVHITALDNDWFIQQNKATTFPQHAHFTSWENSNYKGPLVVHYI